MAYIPEQGDLVWLDFDPSCGQEIMKTRPALVLSRKSFNRHTGMAVVAPVTSTIRNIRLEVVLPDTMKTRGSVLVHQLKSIDFSGRNASFIEKATPAVLAEAQTIAHLVIS